jgi:hypothetical protein
VTASEVPVGPPVAAGSPPPGGDDAEVIRTYRFDVAAARELLARTAELPGTKRELLKVLNEYRAAVFAVAFEGARNLAD